MKKVSLILVTDEKDGTPLGIITEQDLARKVCVNDKSSKEVLSSLIMSSPIITINTDSSPSDAADLMLKNKIKHLLAVEKESSLEISKDNQENDKDMIKPIGVITPMDFTRYKVNDNTDYNNDGDEDNKVEKILEQYKNDFDFA